MKKILTILITAFLLLGFLAFINFHEFNMKLILLCSYKCPPSEFKSPVFSCYTTNYEIKDLERIKGIKFPNLDFTKHSYLVSNAPIANIKYRYFDGIFQRKDFSWGRGIYYSLPNDTLYLYQYNSKNYIKDYYNNWQIFQK